MPIHLMGEVLINKKCCIKNIKAQLKYIIVTFKNSIQLQKKKGEKVVIFSSAIKFNSKNKGRQVKKEAKEDPKR